MHYEKKIAELERAVQAQSILSAELERAVQARSILSAELERAVQARSIRFAELERAISNVLSVRAKWVSDIKPTLDQISNVLSEMNGWQTPLRRSTQNTDRAKLLIRKSRPIRIPSEDAECHSIPIRVEGVDYVLRVSRPIRIPNENVDFER